MRSTRITVSAVGVQGADKNLLQMIAENGNGRLYMVEDIGALPKIFMKETQEAQKSQLVEDLIHVRVAKKVEAIEGTSVETAPPLHGYVTTKPKPTSETILISDLGEPILARWRYGAGTSVAWTSDVKNRWSVDWIRWGGYPRFWAQVVRSSMRRKVYDSYDLFAATWERSLGPGWTLKARGQLGHYETAETLLELGSGAGHNAVHLKRRFRCTLSDVAPGMLDLSRELNPECEHVAGDMRTLRLGRTFDAVLVHDAIVYMTTRDDLRAAAATAFLHTRPGGAAIFAPDYVRETFAEQTELLKGWLAKLPVQDPKIETVKGKPFVLWIFAGAALTLLLDRGLTAFFK